MENKKLWAVFFIASAKILSISAIFGIISGIISNNILLGILSFIACICAQFIVNYYVNILISTRNKKAEFIASQVLKEAAERKLPYNLNCAYCNTLNQVGISFNYENSFECSSCKQLNKVYIQFTTVRITTPISVKENINMVDVDMDNGVEQSTINESIPISN